MQKPELPLPAAVVDLLGVDPRPNFVVELDAPPGSGSIVFTNPALTADEMLQQSVAASSRDATSSFWQWAVSGPASSSSLRFMDVLWTRSVLQHKWVIVGGNAQTEQEQHLRPPPSSLPVRKNSKDFVPDTVIPAARSSLEPNSVPRLQHHTESLSHQAHPNVDQGKAASLAGSVAGLDDAFDNRKPQVVEEEWKEASSLVNHEPFLDVIYKVDWASTPLGPMESWPPRLQQVFGQILVDSRPLAIYWGSDQQTTVYNEAFSTLCGRRHPWVLGKPAVDVWPGKEEQLQAVIRETARTQRATTPDDEWLFFVEEADGTLKETYLRWSLIPIIDSGVCLGFMHSVIDLTEMHLWNRRMKMLIDLGDTLVTAKDVKSYWMKLIEHLAALDTPYDAPLAILYSVHEEPKTSATNEPGQICLLEGSVGVPDGHALIPPALSLRSTGQGLSAVFKQALKDLRPLHLGASDGNLPASLLEGISWRGFGDPCNQALVIPIRPTATREERALGLLVLGLNPRRPFDASYRQLVSLLIQKLATSLASTVLIEEETTEYARRFETVSEFIPMGMCFSDASGNVTFANEAWARMTGVRVPSGGAVQVEDFLSAVVKEDRKSIQEANERLRNGKNATYDFRVGWKADEQHHLGNSHHAKMMTSTTSSPAFEKSGLDLDLVGFDTGTTERHVHAIAKPEKAPDGSVTRILTCLMDVTLLKRTADEAVRRAQQAENLKRMAELATVGMYDLDLEGRLLGANNVFFEMCGLEKVDLAGEVPPEILHPFQSCVVDEDMPIMDGAIARLLAEGKPQTAEVRLKKPFTAEEGDVKVVAPRWVQATFMPVRNPDNVIWSFTGCLSDVSLQKFQLERERQRKEDAIESKRHQENFIDMTSHEMRNPLSAIIHCADAIISSLGTMAELATGSNAQPNAISGTKPPAVSPQDWASLAANAVDNAEVIVSCAQHQKRIVDDILTMSKLDSDLLAVSRIAANPVQIVEQAVKMFEVEARRTDIELDVHVDASYEDVGVTRLSFDPSRVKQVLINLLTNALKFTGTGPTRKVLVTISASTARPTDDTSLVDFMAPSMETSPLADAAGTSITLSPSSSNLARSGGGVHVARGDPVYLLFAVKDTGQGLSGAEKKSLFKRFVQASSRTHVVYGGSGLGLYISKRLTEMQNGAIGVASSPGVGSTFAFYIEAYRLTAGRIPARSAARGFHVAKDEDDEDDTGGAALFTMANAVKTPPLTPPNSSSGLRMPQITSPNLLSQTPTAAIAAAAATVAPLPSVLTAGLENAERREDEARQGDGGVEPIISGVLVVEDNIINQTITRRSLVDKGFTVDVANHGLEALEKLKQSDRFIPDSDPAPNSASAGVDETAEGTTKFPLSVILMDMEMPVMDGLSCTRQIRELERRGQIRGGRIAIIAVSANARVEQINTAKAAGCDDVLVKPYRMPELVETMRRLIKRLSSGTTDQQQHQQSQDAGSLETAQ